MARVLPDNLAEQATTIAEYARDVWHAEPVVE